MKMNSLFNFRKNIQNKQHFWKKLKLKMNYFCKKNSKKLISFTMKISKNKKKIIMTLKKVMMSFKKKYKNIKQKYKNS